MSRTPFLFSVVSAAYNVGPWIGDFLQSLAIQSLDFRKHIQLILVDDGSTDETGSIAAAWAGAYPENTVYIRQENEGAASARNAGLDAAQGAWVTFCDPDDFVCDDYFAIVKNFLESGFDGPLAACNLYLFRERKGGRFLNEHPLRFKFRQGNAVTDLDKHPEYVQLSSASAFFRREELLRNGLRFDERVRPTFEDAHLLNKYLLLAGSRKVAFLRDALYFYRKRAQANSQVDSCWARPEKYREQLVYGHLDLLRFAGKRRGQAPPFIQQAVIYDTQPYMNRMLRQKIPHPFSPEEFTGFLRAMREIYAHIETKQLLFSPLPMLTPRNRVAMLKVFKGEEPPAFSLTVSEIPANREEVLASAVTGGKTAFRFHMGEEPRVPLEKKTMPYRFHGALLCLEHYFRLPLEESRPLSCSADGQAVGFLYNGGFRHTLSAAELARGK